MVTSRSSGDEIRIRPSERDDPDRHYVGTSDLRARLKTHNAGEVTHTSKHLPWRVKTYVAFSDETQALRSSAI